jgi:hypothetical protein
VTPPREIGERESDRTGSVAQRTREFDDPGDELPADRGGRSRGASFPRPIGSAVYGEPGVFGGVRAGGRAPARPFGFLAVVYTKIPPTTTAPIAATAAYANQSFIDDPAPVMTTGVVGTWSRERTTCCVAPDGLTVLLPFW